MLIKYNNYLFYKNGVHIGNLFMSPTSISKLFIVIGLNGSSQIIFYYKSEKIIISHESEDYNGYSVTNMFVIYYKYKDYKYKELNFLSTKYHNYSIFCETNHYNLFNSFIELLDKYHQNLLLKG